MASISYKSFSPDDSSGNQPGPPLGAPEGGFIGKFTNDCLRSLFSAVRNLGDTTLKVSPDIMSGDSVAGLMALQDPAAVAITGGTITGVIGYLPVGSVVDWWGTAAAANALVASGWAVCDGRTITLPGGASQTLPDLRGRYRRGYATGQDPQTTGGSASTSSDPAYPAGTNTAGHALVAAEVPAGLVTDVTFVNHSSGSQVTNFGTQQDLSETLNAGGGQAHAHGMPTAPHSHTLDPPHARFVPLMRVF